MPRVCCKELARNRPWENFVYILWDQTPHPPYFLQNNIQRIIGALQIRWNFKAGMENREAREIIFMAVASLFRISKGNMGMDRRDLMSKKGRWVFWGESSFV